MAEEYIVTLRQEAANLKKSIGKTQDRIRKADSPGVKKSLVSQETSAKKQLYKIEEKIASTQEKSGQRQKSTLKDNSRLEEKMFTLEQRRIGHGLRQVDINKDNYNLVKRRTEQENANLNAIRRQRGENTARAMNYLSILFAAQGLSAALKGMAKSSMQAYKTITKGSDGANNSLSALEANATFVRFAFGQAIADAIAPFMDQIAQGAERISDMLAEHGDWIVLAGAIGVAAAAVGLLLAQWNLLAASMKNLPLTTLIGKAGAKTAGAGAITGSVVGPAAALKPKPAIIPAPIWDKYRQGIFKIKQFTKTTLPQGFVAAKGGIVKALGSISTYLSGSIMASTLALAAAFIGIGWATNKWNDNIEKSVAKWGILGDIINIVSDTFAIFFNFVRTGFNVLVRGTIEFFKRRFEAIGNTVQKVLDFVNKIFNTDFKLPSLDNVVESFENARQKSDEVADSWGRSNKEALGFDLDEPKRKLDNYETSMSNVNEGTIAQIEEMNKLNGVSSVNNEELTNQIESMDTLQQQQQIDLENRPTITENISAEAEAHRDNATAIRDEAEATRDLMEAKGAEVDRAKEDLDEAMDQYNATATG